MKKNKLNKFFSSILAMFMVLSLLTPMSASANTKQLKPFKQNVQTETQLELKAAIAEQMDVLEGGPRLHKNLLGVSGDKEVAVIVHLSEEPVALKQGINELAGKKFTNAQAAKVKANVDAQQSLVKKQMSSKGISVKQGYTFNTVLNGFAATVKANDLKKLLSIPGVTLVEPDVTVYALGDKQSTATKSTSNLDKDGKMEAAMNTSLSFLGIKKLWDEGYKGEGIKVAVLDTGIDKDHPEFAGTYKGGKNFVPQVAGTEYTRTRADDDASETSPLERPANKPEFNANGSAFYTSHGTHVAGTIAAVGNNEYGIKGIAPKVDLYAYRVLGAYGSGATSGIIKAIDTAVIEKMDVINLSLGGGPNSETDSGSFAINNAMMAGTISVIATGNSGPKRGTMGTPSTARLGIAVGNTTNPETLHNGKVNVTVGGYNLSKQLQLMGTTFGKDVATQLQGEFDLVAVPGNGTATDYNGLNVKGKIALVSRGSIAFVDKIAFAKENGAVGVIIHNIAGGTNAPNASGTFLGDSFAFIPAFDMSQTDGDAIRAALKGGTGKVTFGNFASAKTLGDDVNDSSSRGPSTPNFDIKPDVTAPGTNIMSSIAMYKADFPEATYDEAYDRYTGTSMATPHIAGIAALVKQANPNWNAFDVKVALSNTAKILDTAKYDVFSQGAGRVDAYAAAHPGALAYALDKATLNGSGQIVDNLKGTVTFGPQSLKENLSVTKQILVKDLKGKGGDYNVTVDVTKSFGDAKLTIDKPTFTLNGEQMLNVTLTASKNAAPKAGDEILGYIHINGADNEISLPFAADFGGAAATEFKDFNITETDLSFNGDGVQDEALLSFTLTGNVTNNYIELFDIMNPEGGEYGDGYIGYVHAGNSLAAGKYTLAVKGQYKPWTSGVPAGKIPDGLYTFDFSGKTVSGNPAVVGDYVGPVVVKTTKPEITGSVVTGVATGQVTDKYIEYNTELENYGLDFDLNEKLHASYVITLNGVAGQSVPFVLEQNGTFSFPVSTLNAETDTVTVNVVDEAGNHNEVVIFGEVPIPEVPIEAPPIVPVPSNPIDPSNKYVSSFGFDSIAISPNGDGKLDKANFSYVLKEAPKYATTIDVLDPNKYTGTPKPAGHIGDILFDVTKAKTKSGVFDGSYTNGYTYEKGKLNDGIYGMKVNTTSTTNEAITATVKPIFVKSTAPTITSENATDVDATEFTLVGKVEDKFFGYEAVLKEHFGVEAFDVNNYLKASYVVQDKKFKTVDQGTFSINADGTYSIQLVDLQKGQKYKVSVIVQDIAGNDTVEAFTVETVPAPVAVVTLSVNQTDLSIEEGNTASVKVTETTTVGDESVDVDVTADAAYAVEDDAIVSVVAGVITAKAAGETAITITHGEKSVTVNVTVTEKPVPDVKTLKVNKSTVALEVGATEKLVVTETTTKADETSTEEDVTATATYDGFDSDVISVEAGLITAKAVGTTDITITVGDNTKTVSVTVTAVPVPDVKTIGVNKSTVALEVGVTEKLVVTETTTKNGEEPTTKDVTADATYDVENVTVVSVDKGLVTAKAAGTSKVTVTYGGKTAVVNITVADAPVLPVISLSLNKTKVDLTVDGKEQITVNQTVKEAGKDDVTTNVTADATYVVEKEAVVSVDKGLITAKAAGTTKVTVQYKGQSVTLDVNVQNKQVVIPPAPPAPSNPGQVTVDGNTASAQVNDPAIKEVKVDVPALTEAQPEVSAKLPTGSLNTIAQSSKPLVIKSGNTEVAVPNEVLKAIAAGSPESATVSVKMSKSTDINGAASATYEFTITTVKAGITTNVSTFSEPVQVTLPVTATVKNPRKVAAYYVNETSKSLDYVGGTYDNGKFVFKTNHFSKFVVIEHAKTFSDIQKYWAQDEIEVLASRSITSGKTDATFNPEGKITRAEFAVLIARALNLPMDEYQGTFKDVPTSKAWAYAGIEAAYRAGIVNGKTKDSFNPDALITREEIAAIVVRAVKYQDATLLKDVDSSKSFADDKAIGDFAKVSVKQAVGLGIITGRSGNKFDPKANATRAEAAVMLYRALDKMNEF